MKRTLKLIFFVIFTSACSAENTPYTWIDGHPYFCVQDILNVSYDQYASGKIRESASKYIRETPGLWSKITAEFWKSLETEEGYGPQVLLRGLLLCKDTPDIEWQKIFDEIVRQAYLPEAERNRLWPYLMEGGLLTMAERRDNRTEDLAIQLHRGLNNEKNTTLYSHQIRPALEKMGGPKAVEYLDARFQKWVDETIPDPSRSDDLKIDPIAATIRRRLKDEGKTVPPLAVVADEPKPSSFSNPSALNHYRLLPWLLAVASGFGLSWLLRRYLLSRH